jgi:hypothetical protein
MCQHHEWYTTYERVSEYVKIRDFFYGIVSILRWSRVPGSSEGKLIKIPPGWYFRNNVMIQVD